MKIFKQINKKLQIKNIKLPRNMNKKFIKFNNNTI